MTMTLTKAKPVPDGYHTVTVFLTHDEAGKAIDWYVKALGAKALAKSVGPDGKIAHAELEIGDSKVMIADAMAGGKGPRGHGGGSPAALWLYVDDCDALFERAVAAGAKVTMPMGDQFWGDRCGNLRDPFGYDWTIATHIEDLSREQLDARAAEFFAKAGKPG